MRQQILNELARYDLALSCHKLAERVSEIFGITVRVAR